uniref:Retrovirus-related Pol polyprotein from transposon TNT 1-94 n=1 Tax=Tanacetum cinerariifolium TaxID=118510 RepID=A0A6L2JTD8_TANCI|nr:retrovirus-related Pol polyprotein from transposon TNT 1-94 [Tanacetum cinerariifolium]
MRIKESLNVSFDASLPDPKSSSMVDDDRIDEPKVQDLNGSPLLQVNVLDEGVFLGYSQTSKANIMLNKETMRIKESFNVSFDTSLPDPKSSSLVDDDRIDEPKVQDLNGSPSLQVNVLDEVEHSPLIWPTVEENGVIRTKKYVELSAAEKIQADCDMKATNIIFQDLPADIYSLVNHHRVAKDLWERVQLLMQGFVVPIFSPEDDPIACLNKAMAFLTAVASSRGDKGKFILVLRIRAMLLVQGETLQVDMQELLNATTAKVKDILLGNALSLSDQGMSHGLRRKQYQAQTIIPHNAAFQTEDLDTYDFDCDDLSTTQTVLMANISNYGSDVISEVPNSETYLNDMDNQSVHALQDFEQSPIMDFTDNEISSDSNIIPRSQYLQETQQATVQDTNLQAQQDSMILSSVKMIDSQMDDMIREKLALKEQVDSLEQNLSKIIKENESLFKTFTVFKNKSKEKENIYMENEIDLEKKIKELDNILCKVGQSAQTMHMLTKLQAFYDNSHKQALGYQNPFYLKKAQRIKPTFYDGVVLSNTHVAMHDPEVIAKKISHKPIDYEKLNSLTDDFGKRFSPQQQLSAKQAFWFHILNPTIEPSYTPLVIVDVPSELPKVSLVNASLKKLKFYLTQFDYVVKKRTTSNALEEDVLLTVMNSISLNNDSVNMEIQKCESCEKCLNLDAEFSKSKQAYDALLKKYYQLEKHCISLELSIQLNQEIFQKNEFCITQNTPEIPECFKKNDLKAQLQDKDTTICKLKDTINSFKKNNKEEIVDHDRCDLATINEELENSVAKLLSKNERLCKEINHVKHVFKDQFDSIKQTRVLQKEQSDSLINKLNLKSAENEDLKAQIQDKLLVYVRDTCPSAIKLSETKVARTPMNKTKKVTFAKPIASSSTNQETHDSNKPMLHSTGVRCSTSASGSKPSGNTKNNRISQPSSSKRINKVKDQPRSVKTRKNKKNRVNKVKCNDHVMQSMSNANSIFVSIKNAPVNNSVNDVTSGCLCAICGKCMIAKTHHVCVHLVVTKMNESQKSKLVKKHKNQNVWKPMGNVFTDVGYTWKPTGQTFTIVGNSCPLTRFTSTNVVPPKQTHSHSVEIEKTEIKVYSKKPKNVNNAGSTKMAKIVESKNANHSEPNHTWGSIATYIASSSSLVMIGCPDCTIVSRI